MAVLKYRKKPVVIEALLLLNSNEVGEDRWEDHVSELHDFLGDQDWNGDESSLYIETLEGTMTANPGDYIIRGVEGEFYPCKPSVFAATYELCTGE